MQERLSGSSAQSESRHVAAHGNSQNNATYEGPCTGLHVKYERMLQDLIKSPAIGVIFAKPPVHSSSFQCRDDRPLP
jgi:hypothetical protein